MIFIQCRRCDLQEVLGTRTVGRRFFDIPIEIEVNEWILSHVSNNTAGDVTTL